MSPAEGVELPGRWFGRSWVPFDEMSALSAAGVRLHDGRVLPVPARLGGVITRALTAPVATGSLVDDAGHLRDYLDGDWSPVLAARTLLTMATAASASDVHLEPDATGLGCRLRLAGELVPFVALPAETGRRLVAALKHLAGCLPYRRDIVQEGRVAREGVAADVRASFLPTALGERVALRLFGRLRSVDELGLPAEVAPRLLQALRAPSGLFVVAGATGSGKTTTLYAALAAVAAVRGGAHLSVEDPVEQRLRLAGIPVDQVELDPARGVTAEAVLVGALRQDVDVLAVGEVRTAAEAGLAVRAAHTGRLVLAGLHAGSAAEAGQRLRDLEVEPGVLRETLRGVLFQRLETVPCTPCEGCGGLGRRRRLHAELVTPERP